MQLSHPPKRLSGLKNTDNERLKTLLFIAIICLNYSTICDSLVNMVMVTFTLSLLSDLIVVC